MKSKILLTHEVELAYNKDEGFRSVRLERVLKKANEKLSAAQMLNVISLKDHKGCLTVNLCKEDEDTEQAFEDIWENENEVNIVFICELPF